MPIEHRPLKKAAAVILADTMEILNNFSAPDQRAEFDRAWKVGVLHQLSKIAHELEIMNGDPAI